MNDEWVLWETVILVHIFKDTKMYFGIKAMTVYSDQLRKVILSYNAAIKQKSCSYFLAWQLYEKVVQQTFSDLDVG